ncbi:hypothetical protein CANCADRAFT_44969 [Tortispora caseinolytica NRRL Y-17796]|uniref:SET domain-containing protein n=1 Tax=Tortispora caseinolytica NRRL Y-17796 TaxID=767744 RepID=A0A1E4THZ5_9ASCO|nr:hypothetical protein CANCADRAFT_44969 [Tortispora caseinolytica NRRL Y-17796]
MNDTLNDLIHWVVKEGGHVDARVRFQCGPEYTAYASELVEEGTTIIQVPKSCLICTRNSPLSNVIESELSGIVSLAAALLYEIQCYFTDRESTPWAPYIRIIDPPSALESDDPIVRRQTLLDTDTSCQLWPDPQILKGTNVDLIGALSSADLAEMYQLFAEFVDKHMHLFPNRPLCSQESFLWAFNCVSRRAFEIDNYRGLALCPLADLLNHSPEASSNCRFMTPDQVCDTCGSWDTCEHDNEPNEADEESSCESDDISDISSEPPDCVDEENQEEIDFCEIVTHSHVLKNEEILNTYGPLNNATLLMKYGFAIEDNPDDILIIGPQLSSLIRSRCPRIWRYWLKHFGQICQQGISSNLQTICISTPTLAPHVLSDGEFRTIFYLQVLKYTEGLLPGSASLRVTSLSQVENHFCCH